MDLGVLNIVPLDFLIVFVVWVVFSIIALNGGRGEIISVVAGSFVAIVAYNYAQEAYWLGAAIVPIIEQPRSEAIFFVVLVVLGYLAVRQLMLPYGSDLMGTPIQSAIIGFLSVLVLLALWISLPFTSALWEFGALFQMVFSTAYAFWWIAGTLLFMVVFG